LFLGGGRVVGGALIGDISSAGTLHTLIAAGREMDAHDAALLRPQTKGVIRFPEDGGRRRTLILSDKR
ncbi:MAG: hypothetical protein ABIJ57_07930, partial [Pseudomonadota bacterium]